jgi:hypothetical protein
VKNSRRTNEYDDELEIDQSSHFKRIYTYDSNEEEMVLYALETIPKVGVLSLVDQGVQGDNDQSTPYVLSKIQLGLYLHLKERRQYKDLVHKYIHLFVFSYKDFKEVTMEQHKIELLRNAKPVRKKQGRWNPRYIVMVKEKFDKLSEGGFIRPMEIIEWVFHVVLALKKWRTKGMVNYKALKVIKKNQ